LAAGEKMIKIVTHIRPTTKRYLQYLRKNIIADISTFICHKMGVFYWTNISSLKRIYPCLKRGLIPGYTFALAEATVPETCNGDIAGHRCPKLDSHSAVARVWG